MDGAITHIVPLKRDPNLRSLRVDGRVVAWLTTEEVKELGLGIGTPWSDDLARTVKHRHDVNIAQKQALKFLARRDHSVEQLSAKLRLKDWPDEVIDVVIHDLLECGWLDDEACANSIAEESLRRGPQSRSGLEARMRSKGIDASVASRTTSVALAHVEPVDAATELARKKLLSIRHLPQDKKAVRLAGALSRAGFEEDDVRSAIERLGLLPDDV